MSVLWHRHVVMANSTNEAVFLYRLKNHLFKKKKKFYLPNVVCIKHYCEIEFSKFDLVPVMDSWIFWLYPALAQQRQV